MTPVGDAQRPAVEREVRRRYEVPDAILLRVDAREVLAGLGGYEVAVREVAAHPDDLPAAGGLGGRGALRRVESPQGPLLVREYRKGGLLRRLRGRRMRGRWRPLDELVLHRRLAALGVPVPDAVGCVIRKGPTGWRGFLLLHEVEGAVDLESVLHGVAAPDGADPRHVLREAGRVVRKLHDAGVPHPDLHPKNLLLAPGGRVLVIDLDKARPSPGVLSEAQRIDNLARLGRAIEKHRLKGMSAGRKEALRFLEGYAGSPEAARLWLDPIRARLGRWLGLRRVWWRLIGEARPWRPATWKDA
jgi:3-deoxy-D-manno-octulosonic acid kinase